MSTTSAPARATPTQRPTRQQRPGFGANGRKPQGGRGEEDTWTPITKLGRLVKSKRITSIEEIFIAAMPIKESKIIDLLLPNLVEEVMKISPVQKQTRAGQRTRFKAFVIVGDRNGHVGLGVKCAKEVATAIIGAVSIAKLSIIPVRRGYWGSIMGLPHTIPAKASGKCGSTKIRLVPAPRGTGIVAASVPKKLLQFAGIEDCYTCATGSTCTAGNLLGATYMALAKTYEYITPNLWKVTEVHAHPLEKYAEYLFSSGKEGKSLKGVTGDVASEVIDEVAKE